jgi:hypothetical protein
VHEAILHAASPPSRSASRGVLQPRWRRTRVSVGKVEGHWRRQRPRCAGVGLVGDGKVPTKWLWKSWVIWMWWIQVEGQS